MSPILGLHPRDVNASASRPNNTGVVPFVLRLSADEPNNSSAANSASVSQSHFHSLPVVSSTSTPVASVSATTSLAEPSPLAPPFTPPAFLVPSVSGSSTAGSSSVSQPSFVGQEPSSSQATSSTQSSNIQQPSPASSPPNATTSPVSNGSGGSVIVTSIPEVAPTRQSDVTPSFTSESNPSASSAIGAAGPSSSAQTNMRQASLSSTTSPMAAASTALPVFPPDTSSSLSRLPSQNSASTAHVAIAGGVAGGVLLTCVLVAIWLILRRRAKLRSEKDGLRMSVVSHRASMLSQATSLAWIRRPGRSSVYDPSSDPYVADPFRDEMKVEKVYQGSGDEVRSARHSYTIPPSLVPGGVHYA